MGSIGQPVHSFLMHISVNSSTFGSYVHNVYVELSALTQGMVISGSVVGGDGAGVVCGVGGMQTL